MINGIWKNRPAELQKRVVANAKLLLCTHQVASSELVWKNFATVDCDGIVIIGDEDCQSTEPTQLIPLMLLSQSHMVKATSEKETHVLGTEEWRAYRIPET